MRLNIKKTKNKTFYYALDAHREGGKVISYIAEKIGEHSELLNKGISDPLKYANQRIEALNQEKSENKLSVSENYDFTQSLPVESISSNSTTLNIGWLYIHKLYEALGVKDLFNRINGKAKFDLNNIVEYLVVNRFLNPGSKREAFLKKDEFFASPSYSLQDSYRCLTLLNEHDDELQKTLFEGSKSILDFDTSVLYYDCTNFYFECETQDDNLYNDDGDIIQWGLRRYGASKEHRPNPIVQMGLFTDKNGIPLSYCIHHGSNNEQNTVVPLERRMIKDYSTSKFIYCSDGGLGSFENRFFNTIQGRDYVVTQSLKKTANKELDLIFKDLNWRYVNPIYDDNGNEIIPSIKKIKEILDKKYNGETLTLEEEKIISEDMIYKMYPMSRAVQASSVTNGKFKGTFTMDETIYITFSAKYYLYQKALFNKQLEVAKDWINNKDPENIKKGPNDIGRFIKIEAVTKNGEIADEKAVMLNQERIDEEVKFHGFYAVATSLENKSIKEIMDINASRWKIEQSFRILKTDFDARPIYVSTREHIKGHLAICYITLLIYRILERKLLLQNPEQIFSSNQIIQTLKNMNVVEISDGSILQATYTGSSVLEELEKLFQQGLDKKYYRKKKLLKKYN